jgi:hypothetical protein
MDKLKNKADENLKKQEKFELSITAESVESTDERFTILLH